MPKHAKHEADEAAPEVPGAVAVLPDAEGTGVVNGVHLPHEPHGPERQVTPWRPNSRVAAKQHKTHGADEAPKED